MADDKNPHTGGLDRKTRLQHTGHEVDPHTGASSIPIYQVSTYHQEDPLVQGRYEYGRGQNPTRDALEETIAGMEGGVRGFAFGSGVAAIASALMIFKPGDHVVVTEDVYGGTFRILDDLFKRWGLKCTFVDFADPARVEAAILPETVCLYAETPSNPILKITDLKAIAALGKKHGLVTMVDNTFMTPYLQRPIEHGFDVVLHSATKFLGGHSDLIAGLAVTADKGLGKRIKQVQNTFGAILGPQDSYLVLRGIKSLSARMDAEQAGATEIAAWLDAHPAVIKVHHPSLAEHPGRQVHERQCDGPGPVVSFVLEDGLTAQRFLRAVELPLVAVSLGGTESILSYPATMSHAAMPREERIKRGIPDGLVRLSVGLESARDLIADMERALESATKG